MKHLTQAVYGIIGVAGVGLGMLAAAVANTVPLLAFAITAPIRATDHPTRQP